MSNWRYLMVSGSPTAFYIPVVDCSNLRNLERDMKDRMIDLVWADPTALPPWAPGSRHDEGTGFNGSFIDSNFFLVRIHRYKKGASEIDLSSNSLVRAFLFSFDESRKYGEQWQAVQLSNPSSWIGEGAAETFHHARENWDYLWRTKSANVKWDDEYLRKYIAESLSRRWTAYSQQVLGFGDETESYGGTI